MLIPTNILISDISPNSLRNLKYPDERKKPTTAKKRSNVAISEAIPFNLSKSVLPSLLLKNFVLIMLMPIVSCQETDELAYLIDI